MNLTTPSEDNPFGNMWMLMAFADKDNKDMKDMLLPMMLMNNMNQ